MKAGGRELAGWVSGRGGPLVEGAESAKDSGQDLLSGFEEQSKVSRGCLRSRSHESDVEGKEEAALCWLVC